MAAPSISARNGPASAHAQQFSIRAAGAPGRPPHTVGFQLAVREPVVFRIARPEAANSYQQMPGVAVPDLKSLPITPRA